MYGRIFTSNHLLKTFHLDFWVCIGSGVFTGGGFILGRDQFASIFETRFFHLQQWA